MHVTIKTPEEQDKDARRRPPGRRGAGHDRGARRPRGDHRGARQALPRLTSWKCSESIPANLNYRGFPKTICTSVNHVVCHGIPNDKRLKAGDFVNIDVTVIRDGFHGDTSRMYFVGKPPPHAQTAGGDLLSRPCGVASRQ